MKTKIWNISKIVFSLSAIPFWFVKRYEYHQLVAGDDGTLGEIIHHHSMMSYLEHTILPYISIGLLIASAVLNIVVLKYPRLQKWGNIITLVAIGFYCVLREFAARIYFG